MSTSRPYKPETETWLKEYKLNNRPYAYRRFGKGVAVFTVVMNSHGNSPAEKVLGSGKLIVRAVNATKRTVRVDLDIKANNQLIDWQAGILANLGASVLSLDIRVLGYDPIQTYCRELSKALAFAVRNAGIEVIESQCAVRRSAFALQSEFETELELPPVGQGISSPDLGRDPMTPIRTVLELDMAAYGKVARLLDEAIGPQIVAELNSQIQGFVDHSLEKLGLTRLDVVMATTGDGAILVFDQPQQAHSFAEYFYALTKEHNRKKTSGAGLRVFRMGAATGQLQVSRNPGRGFDIAGIVIASAVRFEARALPGQIIVDAATFDGLSKAIQRKYGDEEEITGKPGEHFRVRRCQIDSDAGKLLKSLSPDTKSAFDGIKRVGLQAAAAELSSLGSASEQLDLLKAMESLGYPEYALDHVIIAMSIPKTDQPSKAQNHGARCTAVIDWAIAKGKLNQLRAVILYFLDKYSGTDSNA